MKEMIISVLFLAFVSAIAGAAITFFNDMTAPIIAVNAEREEQATLRKMYPDGEFTEISGYTESEEILAVSECFNRYAPAAAAGDQRLWFPLF